ncbi:hypothetical protein V8E53_000539 [Lactarius tabidus]
MGFGGQRYEHPSVRLKSKTLAPYLSYGILGVCFRLAYPGEARSRRFQWRMDGMRGPSIFDWFVPARVLPMISFLMTIAL